MIINMRNNDDYKNNFGNVITHSLYQMTQEYKNHNNNNNDKIIILTKMYKYLNEEVDDTYYIIYRYNINIFVNKQAEYRIKAHEIINELNYNVYLNMIKTFDIFLNRVRLNN
jgi:hypothetical protein